MSRPIETPNASATQTENPGRASTRTFVQAWALPTILIVLAAPELFKLAFQVVEDHGGTVPPWLVAAAAGVTTTIALIAQLSARIMAIPGVEKALRETPGLRWLAAAETETDIGHDGDDSEEYEEDDPLGLLGGDLHSESFAVDDEEGYRPDPNALEDSNGTTEGEPIGPGLRDTTDLSDLEPDLTPPPDGYEPRH